MDFQSKFLNALQSLKDLENNLFQTYINSQAKFAIETYESNPDQLGGRREVLRSFDITEQIKESDFDLNNSSYILKLHFALNDTVVVKDYI